MTSPLESMDGMAIWVASMTGAKAQLIEQGWSPEVAEQMVLEVVRSARVAAEAAARDRRGRRA